MPPPPVTPSPHRFVIRKEPPVRRTPLVQAHTPRPSTPQFNSTPRFTFSQTPRPTQGFAGPTSSAARFATPGPKARKTEDVIDNSSEDPPQSLKDSIEVEEDAEDLRYGSAGEEQEEDYRLEEEPTPKRRRLTSPLLLDEEEEEDPDLLAQEQNQEEEEDELSSSLPVLSSPPAPRRPASSGHPKFLLSTALPPSAPQPSNPPQTFLKPPRFRPPDLAEAQSTSDPLPEHFSPHRKGHKYVPGGLAAEVRDWLVNIESSVPAQKIKENPWAVKLLVDEVNGGGRAGMTLVKAKQIHDTGDGESMVDYLREVRVMLAGEGQGEGVKKGPKVQVGNVIGINGPVWEVVIEDCKWGVGVDWKVL